MKLRKGTEQKDKYANPKEMSALALDTTTSQRVLGWQDRLGGKASIEWTIDWYLALHNGEDMREKTRNQVETFMEIT